MTGPAQSDGTPTAKVTAGVLSAATVTILIAVSHDVFHYDMSATLAGALVTVGGFAAAYFKKSRPGEHDV
jgi:hypothetical protein